MSKNIDVFGNDLNILKNKKLFLFDMDGTIYNDNKLFPNVIELLSLIKENKGQYVFITNNSSKSVNNYIDKLSNMGISVNYDNFLTSSQATIIYLKEKYLNKKIYCMGTNAFVKELKENEIDVVTEVDDSAEVVLIGYDTELNYKKLIDTCKMLKKDVHYIATNPDLVCPTEFGFIPDCGSITQMIYNATGKKPINIGKPEPTMINLAMKKFNFDCDETLVIGDRLYTDILSGLNANVLSVCVLTGEATVEEIIDGSIKPDIVLNNVSELYNYLKSFE